MIPRMAVVLAAGLGSRLGYTAKPLVNLRGRPLIWYPLSVLHLLGVSEVCIVARRGVSDAVGKVASSVLGRGAVHVVVNSEPERENGYSLILALRECGLNGRFFVSMSDHIYTPLIPARVAAVDTLEGYVIGGDSSPCCVDVEEATRITAVSWVGYGVGKGLQLWTHIDTGVHLASFIADTILEMVAGERVVKLNTITSRLASAGRLLVADVSGLPWTEIDTPSDLEEAERGSRSWVVSHVEDWIRG